MTHRDIDRLRVIRDVIERKLIWKVAAEMLDLGIRQVGRLCAQIRKNGNCGILHGLRGKPSNHRLDPEILGMALSALHDPQWRGFRPTFAREKLEDHYGIVLSEGTVRALMIETGLWQPRRRGATHRAWRERRSCVGMLVQLDGSDHDWFEGRGPRCILLVYIDDATSRILHAEFVHVEDTRTLLRSTWDYLKLHGRPLAFYVDKDSIYTVNRQATVEEELRDEQPMTQFTRAMNELGIEVILAHSPQAKGRVERGFATHQDRLVKELRLAGISTMEEANKFLRDVYIPAHNARYAVKPAQPNNAHRPLLPHHDLPAILAIHTPREVGNDFTVRYRNRLFQIHRHPQIRIYPGAKVSVQERLDRSLHLVFKDRALNFHPLPESAVRRPVPRKIVAASAAKKRRPKVDPFFAAFSLKRVEMNQPASAFMQT